jgi:hypothetical protein
LGSYGDAHIEGVWEVLRHRVAVEPFNLVATLFFLGAVLHTFFTHKFRDWAHHLEQRALEGTPSGNPPHASMPARALHFLGEVEAVFGIWVLPLGLIMSLRMGQGATVEYLNHRVHYHEPLFVVVIMAMASTRPVLMLAERVMRALAGLGGGKTAAWWWSILTLGPLMGSLITEPAAMTICASLLARQFYELKPRLPFAYATLGLLFVNISVGGTLTHFAAPPVLMVAGPWKWDTVFMSTQFGWKAALSIVISNGLYSLVFRRDFDVLQERARQMAGQNQPDTRGCVPFWVTAIHLLFMGFAVLNAHNPAIVIGSFLFFLALYEVTKDHQAELSLRSPILVGFFLAGLVIHGGLQQWWIGPVLGRLAEIPLMLGAMVLTAFNDNAAITYLGTLVPDLSNAAKYALVAGAVTGGGLTVIANAPNPAGQAILNRFFPHGVSPLGLFLGALTPTAIVALTFLLFR